MSFFIVMTASRQSLCYTDDISMYNCYCFSKYPTNVTILQVEYDRPIAGFINICPEGLSTHETQLHLAIATIKHEILHALVITRKMLTNY